MRASITGSDLACLVLLPRIPKHLAKKFDLAAGLSTAYGRKLAKALIAGRYTGKCKQIKADFKMIRRYALGI
jgi:hypothetical protein